MSAHARPSLPLTRLTHYPSLARSSASGSGRSGLRSAAATAAAAAAASASSAAAARTPSVLTFAVSPRTPAHSDSEPRPVPCLWLRPCNGVRLPGGSAGARTHWDLSARVCPPLGPSRFCALFSLLTRIDHCVRVIADQVFRLVVESDDERGVVRHLLLSLQTSQAGGGACGRRGGARSRVRGVWRPRGVEGPGARGLSGGSSGTHKVHVLTLYRVVGIVS